MALITQSSSLLLHSPLHPLPTKTKLTIRSQDPSPEPKKPTINGGPIDDTSSVLAPPKKPNSTGLGFGSSSSSAKPNANPSSTKSKPRSRRERASIIRRSPVEKPEFLSQQGEAQSKDQSRNESAFLLAWLGLGSIILVEGIVLAASGFLPEKWDKFFVKYLYPSFTPTVFLFVAGTVGYGVLKYLQNEELKSKK